MVCFGGLAGWGSLLDFGGRVALHGRWILVWVTSDCSGFDFVLG